ncbi:PREDICTED: GDP-fucose protein O-fucosyltransferase 2 [Polistes dominula]|uniref:GDP-fucose protein O-fucosyltransferase 2 n=1 Tax=Polistes dominula TaxID=743375 RepID=A0ABM1IHW9_POLDO|nr:PREDICTED: GDP-fucose protein O-fucosyltransferase 2 [Polistes dominula]
MFDIFFPGTLCFILISVIFTVKSENYDFCPKSDEIMRSEENCGNFENLSNKRYILYDVNPPEGFNLRRDVYVRVAVFIKNLSKKDKKYDWHLVLPPWGDLYHWRSKDVGPQVSLPWGLFFDIASLQKYAPVIEMYKFFEEYFSNNKKTQLDIVYNLQNDEEMFKTGLFDDKNKETECSSKLIRYRQLKEEYIGYFWNFSNVTSKQVKCILFHGTTSNLKVNLNPSLYRSVMFDHMEIPLHDSYGSKDYWKARRSMRYNSELYHIASDFRAKYLNSTDKNDNTERPLDWTKEKKKRNAIGGPYLSVHLRRRDFLVGRTKSVPTIKGAAFQLANKMKEYGLELLFVATDADEQEIAELKSYLPQYRFLNYVPSNDVKRKFKDGGIAIIDQIICSYARYFIGTHESTFTFRIQEDREIIGFPPERTFNRLCKTKEKCSSGERWEIAW